MVKDGQTTNYNYYSNGLDQLQSDGTNTYTYDGRGNLAQVVNGIGTTTYNFDAADRLAGVAKTGSTSLTANYLYDGDGRRVKATNNGTVTNYLWDEKSTYGDVVLETDASNAIVVDYLRSYNGALYTQDRNNTTSYYLYDGQGNVRALADTSGNLTDRYAYDAFGTQHSTSGTTPNSYLYTGQQFDNLTGLYDLRARYLDTAQGRFLSRDKAQSTANDPFGLDRYLYVADNPINAVDPSGHQAFIEYSETQQQQENTDTAIGTEGGTVTESNAEVVDSIVDEQVPEDEGIGAACSFSADTPVLTNQGNKPIASLKPGDLVWGYDNLTKTTISYPVKAVLVHTDINLEFITIDSETIQTTPEHPFYTQEQGWVVAGKIQVGSHIRNANGHWGIVQQVRIVSQSQPMYDLTVDKIHTFFVGQQHWLVHNCDYTDPKSIRFSQDSIKATFKDGRSVDDLIADLKSGKLTSDDVDPIRVFEKDGQQYTLDNRRLYAFQQANVPIRTVPATEDEIANEGWKFTTTNDGVSIRVRGR
jgi:RHS repeat-associated protein